MAVNVRKPRARHGTTNSLERFPATSWPEQANDDARRCCRVRRERGKTRVPGREAKAQTGKGGRAPRPKPAQRGEEEALQGRTGARGSRGCARSRNQTHRQGEEAGTETASI